MQQAYQRETIPCGQKNSDQNGQRIPDWNQLQFHAGESDTPLLM